MEELAKIAIEFICKIEEEEEVKKATKEEGGNQSLVQRTTEVANTTRWGQAKRA